MIEIEYCEVWNYYGRAAGAAAHIESELGWTVQLVPSSGGIFEVRVDGQVVCTKTSEGIPANEAIVRSVRLVMDNR